MKKKFVMIGAFAALALIVSYIEMLIPMAIAIPGIKLGLANIVVIVALYCIGIKEAFFISMVRVIVVFFLFGNMSSILYSLSGAILSFAVMSVLMKLHKFSIIGVSVVGGVFHNIGQVIVAAVVVDNFYVLLYLPILIIVGVFTGLLIGVVAKEVKFRLPRDCM